jgi:putative integral membrane protein (TIGR02587 family)
LLLFLGVKALRRGNENHASPQGEASRLFQALASGIIFGMPLLYTMEMWWHGVTFGPVHLLVFLCAVLFVNFVASKFLGFLGDSSLAGAAKQAVVSVGIGMVISAGILALIGELKLSASTFDLLGQILIQASVVSVGISIGSARFRAQDREGKDKSQARDDRETKPLEERETLQLKADLRDAGATLVGAVIFAFNVAPTEEVVLIATRLSPLGELAFLAAEFGICYVILFASGFWRREIHFDSAFQHALAEVTMTVSLSLGVAACLMLLVGHAEPERSLSTFMATTLSLGLPAVAGGAAGRLVS